MTATQRHIATRRGPRWSLFLLSALALSCGDDADGHHGNPSDAGRDAASLDGGVAQQTDAAASAGGQATNPSSDGGVAQQTDAATGGGQTMEDAGTIAFDAGTPPLSPPDFPLDESTLERAAVGLLSCISDNGFYRDLAYLRGTRASAVYPGGAEFIECLSEVTTGCTGVARCLDDAGDPTGEACDWRSFEEHCDALGRPTICDDYVVKGPVCADAGLECALVSREPRCQGTGPDCVGGSSGDFELDMNGMHCRGPILEGCFGRRLDAIDCRNIGPGFTCHSSGDSVFCGTASECDPTTFRYECDGNEVIFCNAGKLRRFDCTTLGFDTCSDDPRRVCE